MCAPSVSWWRAAVCAALLPKAAGYTSSVSHAGTLGLWEVGLPVLEAQARPKVVCSSTARAAAFNKSAGATRPPKAFKTRRCARKASKGSKEQSKPSERSPAGGNNTRQTLSFCSSSYPAGGKKCRDYSGAARFIQLRVFAMSI